MNTHEGYSKKTLTNTNVLLTGGGDKSLADFLGGIRISASKIQYKTADAAASWTDLITLVNTDENVKQTPKTDNVNRPLMMINGGTATGTLTSTSMFSTGIYANASTKMITAGGFVKTGSDSSHVLLGDGSHKAISDFATSTHNHDRRYMRTYGTVGSGNALFDVDVDPGYEGTITYDPVAANMKDKIENNPNVTALNLGNNFGRRKQLLFTYSNDNIYYRRRVNPGNNNPAQWTTAVKLLHSGNILDWLTWNNISGKPSSFTPSAHTHNMNDIKWPGGHNLITSAAANGQEWSIDCTPGSYTGTYWLVWRATTSGISVSGTMLKVDCDTGKVSAPYGFVGNLTGNVTGTATGNVTALSINGNYLRWTKNGSNSDLTIPYATNADKLDGYHSMGGTHPNWLYKHTQTYENTTAPTADWFVKIVLDVHWNHNLTNVVLSADYSNRRGVIYLDLDAAGGDWRLYHTNYNTNFLALKRVHNITNGDTEIYVKLAKPIKYNSAIPKGKIQVWSPVTIKSITVVSDPGNLVTLNYGYNATSPVTSAGFKKKGSSNSYVLLGEGGHKAINDFATSTHNHDDKYVTFVGVTDDSTNHKNQLRYVLNGTSNYFTVPYSTTSGTSDATYFLYARSSALESPGVQFIQGQIKTGSSDGLAYSGSSSNFKVLSFPPNATAINSQGTTNESANVAIFRIAWGTTYWHDLHFSPNNNNIYHRVVFNSNAIDWRTVVETTGNKGNSTKPVYVSGGLIYECDTYPTKASWNYDDKYVTALGTSSNYLTWTKNGTTNNITVPYALNADTVDGYHAVDFAKIGAHNNLTASGNEFTFASGGFSGSIWLNYRTASGNLDGNITEYILGNGAGSSLGTIIHSGNIGSQSVNYATSAGNADTVDGYHADHFLNRLDWWGESDSHDVDTLTSGIVFAYTTHNAPATGTIATFSGTNNTYPFQIMCRYYTDDIYFRSKNGDNNTWQAWRSFIHSGNIASQSVNYASSAGSVAWANVTGKPSTFTPSTHDHDDRYYTESEADDRFVNVTGDTMTGSLTVKQYIFGYNYNHAGGNAPAFIFDKPGSNYTGIGANGEADTIYFSAATISNGEASWVTSYKQKWKFNGTIHAAGGNMSGHIYLTGSVANSSTSNTSQIVFGTSSNLHVVISSNTKAIIINPSTGSTTGQTIIGVDTVESAFGSNVKAPNFYTTSDRNKKQNISSLSEHIRKFQLKDTEKWHYGVIAQEVDEMFRDGEEGNMTVNYNSILSFYIGLLENKVKILEERIKRLESK